MNELHGLTIQNGVAYGKIHKIIPTKDSSIEFDLYINQKEILNRALQISSEALEKAINTSTLEYDDRIAMIFEAHKLMVKDPMLLEESNRYIEQGMNAYQAYKTAAENIINQFKNLSSDYMVNRIIDIEDATDRVLFAIQDTAYELELAFDQPRILAVPEMKPSIILGVNRNHISGFITESGSYDQHSSVIARKKGIPGMIVREAMKLLNDNDWVLLDADKSIIYINPTKNILSQYKIKGEGNDEL